MSNNDTWEKIAANLNNEGDGYDFGPHEKLELEESRELDAELKANKKLVLQLQGRKVGQAWKKLVARKKRQNRVRILFRTTGSAAAALLLFAAGYLLKAISEPAASDETTYTTLSIPYAEMGNITLSDGTHVFLNSGTDLKFNDLKKSREVYLTGEAFFEVKSDKKHPFLIHLDDFTVKVTGTTFNIKAYPESDFETILVEGNISLQNSKGTELLTMKPDEIVSYNKSTKQITVSSCENNRRLDWRNGEIFLKNKPVEDIAKTLERWFDVDIEFADESIKHICLTGTILKNKPIEQILEVLKISEPLKYSYEYEDEKLVKIRISR